jgi:hypothetical protein
VPNPAFFSAASPVFERMNCSNAFAAAWFVEPFRRAIGY